MLVASRRSCSAHVRPAGCESHGMIFIQLTENFCTYVIARHQSYPPRGVLFYSWPGPWQVWRLMNIENKYEHVISTPERPTPSRITDAFRADSYKRRKKAESLARERTSIDSFLQPQLILAALALFGAIGLTFVPFETVRDILHHLN